MTSSRSSSVVTTRGILLGHEISEWAGFKAGRIVVKAENEDRLYLHYSKDSLGEVPSIGCLVSIEHKTGPLPEIIRISTIDESQIEIYKEGIESYEATLILGRPKGAVVIALVLIICGFWMVLIGLSMVALKPMAPYIFGGCGIPQIIIGLMLFEYSGK